MLTHCVNATERVNINRQGAIKGSQHHFWEGVMKIISSLIWAANGKTHVLVQLIGLYCTR